MNTNEFRKEEAEMDSTLCLQNTENERNLLSPTEVPIDLEDMKVQLEEQLWDEINQKRRNSGFRPLRYNMEYSDLAENYFKSINGRKYVRYEISIVSLNQDSQNTISTWTDMKLPLNSSRNQYNILSDLKGIDYSIFGGDRYSCGAILVEIVDGSIVTILLIS